MAIVSVLNACYAGRDALWPGAAGKCAFAYRQLAYRHRGITGYWRGDDCTSDAGRGYAPPFVKSSYRNMALGVWAAVVPAEWRFGPLIGRHLIVVIFTGDGLINAPIVLVVMGLTARYVPRRGPS